MKPHPLMPSVVMVLLAVAGSSSAGPITPFTTASAITETCPNSTPPPTNSNQQGLFCDSANGGNLVADGSAHSAAATVTENLGGATTSTASASATAEFGTLGAAASTEFDIAGTPQRIVGGSSNGFMDVLTVDSDELDGQPGIFALKYLLSGTLASSGQNTGAAGVTVGIIDGADTANPFQFNTDWYFSTFSGTATVPAFPFTFGQPFALFVGMGAFAGTYELIPTVPSDPSKFMLHGVLTTGVGSGNVSFADTLTVAGFSFSDTSGNDVTRRVIVTSQSGTEYPLTTVPEPATWLLVASGLVAGYRRMPKSFSA